MGVFLSHSSEDLADAEQLRACLAARGIDVWMAVHDIAVGENYAGEIYRAIKASTQVVILMSPPAASSEHVKREVNLAITLGVPLLPVSLSGHEVDAAALTGDWQYWLGVVQIVVAGDTRGAAEAISQRLAVAPVPAPASASTSSGARRRAAPAPQRSGLHLEAEIRSVLIKSAGTATPFDVALDRTRRLGATTEETTRIAQQLRAARLLDFAEPLGPATIMRLT